MPEVVDVPNGPSVIPPAPDTSGASAPPPDVDGSQANIGDLINSMASRSSPMVRGGRPTQDPNQVPRPDVPLLYKFIRQMVNPGYGVQAGQRVPSRAGAFEDFLGNFMNALGTGMQNAGRGPGANIRGAGAAMSANYNRDLNNFQLQQQTDENQARIAQQNAQTAATQENATRVPYTIPGVGTVMIPQGKIGDVIKAQIGANAKENVADTAAGARTKVAEIQQGMGMKLPKEIADAVGMPDLADRMVGKGTLDNINKILTAKGKNIAVGDIGNGHVGTFNKTTGEVLKDFGQSQRLVAAKQGAYDRAYWQAKFGVVAVQDENGTHYESRLNAPGMATAQHSFDVVKGKAGLANYKDALSRMSDNMDIMNDTGQRLLVAQTLRQIGTVHDPGVISSLIGNAVSEGLDPKAADLVAATLQAREFIGANRQFAGNFQGSEALYQRMISNVPGAANSVDLNRRLIKQDMDNTARIDEQLRKFQGGKQPKGGDGVQIIRDPKTNRIIGIK